MDGRLTRINCDEAGDYVVPNVLSPRDLVSRPDNMDETILSSYLSLTFIIHGNQQNLSISNMTFVGLVVFHILFHIIFCDNRRRFHQFSPRHYDVKTCNFCI